MKEEERRSSRRKNRKLPNKVMNSTILTAYGIRRLCRGIQEMTRETERKNEEKVSPNSNKNTLSENQFQ